MLPQLDGHSAKVSLMLLVEGYEIPLAQLLPGVCYAQQIPQTLPPCQGEIIVVVDGRRSALPVSLRSGITSKVIDFHPDR